MFVSLEHAPLPVLLVHHSPPPVLFVYPPSRSPVLLKFASHECELQAKNPLKMRCFSAISLASYVRQVVSHALQGCHQVLLISTESWTMMDLEKGFALLFCGLQKKTKMSYSEVYSDLYINQSGLMAGQYWVSLLSICMFPIIPNFFSNFPRFFLSSFHWNNTSVVFLFFFCATHEPGVLFFFF